MMGAKKLLKTDIAAELRKYLVLKKAVKQAEDEINEIAAKIKKDMGKKELIEVDGIKVNYTRYIKNQFDSKNFRKDNENLYQKYINPVSSTRFTVDIA